MILILNLGSTSLKYQLYTDIKSCSKKQYLIKAQLPITQSQDWANLWQNILDKLLQKDIKSESIKTVLHRVVFAPIDILQFQETNLFEVSDQLLDRLDDTSDFAPLHNPVSLGFVRFVQKLNLDTKQFLVFDNYLYRNVTDRNYKLAIPKDWEKDYHLRRYGYHGLAHKSMLNQLVYVTQATKVLTIQLGGGCSITAFDGGVPLINSMGFGANSGLIMATRSGDIDSGAIIHLLNQPRITTASLQYYLHHKSGLFALAGQEYQGDMRLILANLDNANCKQALEVFVDSVVGYIGNYWLRFGGFQEIAFGGGIGEGSDIIRDLVIKKLNILGISLDLELNTQANETQAPKLISAQKSNCQVWVIPVNEAEVMMEGVDS